MAVVPLTDPQYVLIRRFVGSGFTGSEIDAAYERNETLRGAALELLEIRRADFLVNPLAFTIVSEYSQDASKNLVALDALIESVRGNTDDLDGPGGGIANILENLRRYQR